MNTISKKLKKPSMISFIGAILIFVNTALIAMNNSPILIFSSIIPPEGNIENTVSSILNQTSWMRISLGIANFSQHPFTIIFMIIFSLNLLFTALTCLGRRSKLLNFCVFILSLFSIVVGGGFIIGLILCVIGSTAEITPRIPIKEHFFIKILRALKFDSSLYRELTEKPYQMGESILVILLVGIVSSLSSSLYSYNAEKILNSPTEAFNILFLGHMFWDNSLLVSPLISISFSVFKWLMLTLLFYFIAAKLMRYSITMQQIARVIPFTYSPVLLQAFLPLVFGSKSILEVGWPTFLFIISNLWICLLLIAAFKYVLDISTSRSLGLVMLTGSIYWFINYQLIIPFCQIIDPSFRIPGLILNLQPLGFNFFLISLAIIICLLTGVPSNPSKD